MARERYRSGQGLSTEVLLKFLSGRGHHLIPDENFIKTSVVVVLVNSSWSLDSQKRRWLSAINVRAEIDAVKHQRFVTIDFSSSTRGIRNIAAVRSVAEAGGPAGGETVPPRTSA